MRRSSSFYVFAVVRYTMSVVTSKFVGVSMPRCRNIAFVDCSATALARFDAFKFAGGFANDHPFAVLMLGSRNTLVLANRTYPVMAGKFIRVNVFRRRFFHVITPFHDAMSVVTGKLVGEFMRVPGIGSVTPRNNARRA